MKKNIVIVHYNTPYLTECLVRSINLFVDNAIIYIFDNSDKEPFIAKFDNVTILDNTHGDIIDFDKWLENYPDRTKSSAFRNNYGSAKHCYSIDKCMDILGENFILLDSDVLLKGDITKLFDEKLAFVGSTEIWKAKTPMPNSRPRAKIRAIPYICFINTQMCKKYGIRYFNDNFIYGLTPNGDSYDTGSYFFEQVIKKELKWKKINYNNYIVHYKAATWVDSAKNYDKYNPISIDKWLIIHKNLWNTINENNSSKIKNKKVIYTCITGGYDDLKDPKFISDGFDYICFTDNTEITSNVWTIRPLPTECEELSQVKKQRYVKINPHKLLKDYDISIWVDGSISVNGDLNDLLEETIKEDASIYVPTHPSRNCIYKEARAVISMHKDTEEHVKPQVNRYKNEGFPSEYGLLQSNILIRKHNNDDCIKFMEAWFDELKDNSHRDQLSFNYIAWKNNEIKIIYLNKTICKSKWFYWNASHKKSTKKAVITRNSNTEEIIKKVKQRIEERNLIKRKSANSFGYRLSTYG